MKITNNMIQRGEMAIWGMSAKAKEGYANMSPIDIYEYEDFDDDGFARKRYGMRAGGYAKKHGMTYDELEEYLEQFMDIPEGVF